MREHDRSALHGDLDALILGGGPAGATAAAILAGKGRNVLVVEREQFPRYKVGESLLPYCYFPLERIGMVDKLRASSFVKKYSVQFAAMDGRISTPFYFFQHFDHAASQTWQVVRSEFDQMMLDNAVEKGARVLMGATAKRLLMDGGRCEGLLVERDGETFPVRAPVKRSSTARPWQTAGSPNIWRQACAASRSASRRSTRIARGIAPATVWCWQAMPSPFSTRCFPPGSCWLCLEASAPPTR